MVWGLYKGTVVNHVKLYKCIISSPKMVDKHAVFKLQQHQNKFPKFIKSCIFVHSSHVLKCQSLVFSNSYMEMIYYL